MKISVITTVLNRVDYIVSCLESVEFQSYDNIEHVIIDGGSTDGTLEAVHFFARRNAKIKRVIHSERDDGVYDGLNKGIRLATGDVIAVLHSDDRFSSRDVLGTVAACISSSPGCNGVYGNITYVNNHKNDRQVRKWRGVKFKAGCLFLGWAPAHPSLIIRKSVYADIGLYDTSLKIAADYDFMLRLFLHSPERYLYCDRDFVRMMVGGVSTKKHNIIKILNEDKIVLKRYFKFYLIPLFCKKARKLSQFIQ